MSKFLAVLPLWFSLCASAVEMRDPKALLSQLDQVVGRRNFAQAFHCGDTAQIRIFNKDCHFGCDANFGCMAICTTSTEEFARMVGECSDQAVSFIDGDGSVYPIVADAFRKSSGNLLRQELEGLDQFVGLPGHIELDDLKPISVAMPPDKTTEALELTGRYVTASGSFALLYDVATDAPGVAQILYKRFGNQKIFKVRGFERKLP